MNPDFLPPARCAFSTRERENGLFKKLSLKRPFSLSRVGKSHLAGGGCWETAVSCEEQGNGSLLALPPGSPREFSRHSPQHSDFPRQSSQQSPQQFWGIWPRGFLWLASAISRVGLNRGVMTFGWQLGCQYDVKATASADSILASDCRAYFGRPSTRKECPITCDGAVAGVAARREILRERAGKQLRIPLSVTPLFRAALDCRSAEVKFFFLRFFSAKGVVKFLACDVPCYVFQGLGVRRKISPKFHVKNGVENGKFHANFTLLGRSADPSLFEPARRSRVSSFHPLLDGVGLKKALQQVFVWTVNWTVHPINDMGGCKRMGGGKRSEQRTSFRLRYWTSGTFVSSAA